MHGDEKPEDAKPSHLLSVGKKMNVVLTDPQMPTLWIWFLSFLVRSNHFEGL
jgi:hypothetical protein